MSRSNADKEPRNVYGTTLLQNNASLLSNSKHNLIPSSSPAFGTPVHPIQSITPMKASILPMILPPATLRPVAFRIFSNKHSLTLTSSALQLLATFIGRHCGTEWRKLGLAERVLEEVARSWKKCNNGVIVDGERQDLKDILQTLEGCMVGGRVVSSRQSNRPNVVGDLDQAELNQTRLGLRPANLLAREDSSASLGLSGFDLNHEDDDEDFTDPRKWLRIVDAFEQPRLVYNFVKKNFDRDTLKPSFFPPASHKTKLFRNRYNLVHQRLLRNESFQTPTFDSIKSHRSNRLLGLETEKQFYKLTAIANLLGRNGTNHMILGLLTISPTGALAINDLTGSIALDLTLARPIPEDGVWFAPGMIVLVDGTYVEEDQNTGARLEGVGGSIGGKLMGFFVGGPPCEQRNVTLGFTGSDTGGGVTAGGGFGWVDFLGLGSERAVGSKMRNIQHKIFPSSNFEHALTGKSRIVILGEVNLDQPIYLQALRKVLGLYANEPEPETPLAFVLMGNFVQYAIMARGGSGGSIEYKEYFDSLASILSEYPTLLQNTTFYFVPGDNDAWASSFGAGAATALPHQRIPEIFTSRIKRAFAAANAEAGKSHGTKTPGAAVWTSNPARVTLFGPTHEILLFRDDMTSRLRRNAIRFAPPSALADSDDDGPHSPTSPAPTPDISAPRSPVHATVAASHPDPTVSLQSAQRLVKTLLDQGYLSPFPLAQRPVQWDYASALQVYPLPTALILADADAAAFAITYEGCCVMNPGRLVVGERRGLVRWVEYNVISSKGTLRDITI
ncbi:hypothetical protein K3495_g4569 [Podosphaera aphanis]|nr:hypothetical protein K3495_g4569 [Podosphaera aphanis]